MIVTTPKPLDEILDFLLPYTNILIAGCDGCTQPPRGIREAKALSQLVELGGKLRGKNFKIKTTTVAKQCDTHLVTGQIPPVKAKMQSPQVEHHSSKVPLSLASIPTNRLSWAGKVTRFGKT